MSILKCCIMIVEINKELLEYLMTDSYTALFKPSDKSYFIPVQGEMDELIGQLDSTPFAEDILLALDDVMRYYDDFDLEGKFIDIPE